MKKQNEENMHNASLVLGILSVSLCWLSWPAMILGIIGLCVKKKESSRKAAITLNTIGLILSSVWLIYVLIMISEV